MEKLYRRIIRYQYDIYILNELEKILCPPIIFTEMTTTARQRDHLRFCKAFFEVVDLDRTEAVLEAMSMVHVGGPATPQQTHAAMYWWEHAGRATETAAVPTDRVFLVRLFTRRLILEGPTPEASGLGWRALAETLGAAAEPRVAVGDDLRRFLPKPRRGGTDRPENLTPERERQVLAEFYAAFCQRWLETPHALLRGETPRKAARLPELANELERALARLDCVEEARRSRRQACFSVDRLRRSLGLKPHREEPR